MKVWIVFWNYEYGESRDYIGTFDSKEKAENRIRNPILTDTYDFDIYKEFVYSYKQDGECFSIIETEVK